MAYIYKITNQINNKIYVGKTLTNLEKRWKEHVADSKKEKHSNRPLYRAFNKYGVENFQISLIEECEPEEINEKEIKECLGSEQIEVLYIQWRLLHSYVGSPDR